MKKFLVKVFGKRAALLLAVPLFFLSASLTLAAEKIDNYAVSIELKRDASFSVEETIIYNFGNEHKHGIYREIPIKHPQPSSGLFKQRYTDFSNIEVKMDGVDVPIETKRSWGVLKVRIGDPDKTVTGKHTYTITYDVTGGLQYFENGAPELYWDAVGTEWSAPIGGATVSVTAPSGMLTGSSACYSGGSTSANSCGEALRIQNGYQYRVGNLGPNQGVTVAFAIDGKVPTVVLEKMNLSFMLVPILLIALFGAIFGGYRYKTKFKTGRAIVAQYEPYPGVKPMYTGLLMDGRLDPHDITAGIVYLAQQGYIKIRKIDKKVLFFFEVDDYEIELQKTLGEELSVFQRDILSLLFSTLNPGDKVTLSDLKTNYSKQKSNQLILTRLRKELMSDLKNEDYYQTINVPWNNKWFWIIAVGAVVLAVVLPIVFVPVLFLLLMGVAAFARRRTQKGYEALDHLKGFKDFLKTTEAERYKFHNAPTKSPEQFMEYLPYAIALGVEKEWAEVFKDITIPDPGWYDGGTTGAAFSATNLTTSLGSFSTAFASLSGSAGGSGGGGSVGGGGGGGGGGSW